MSQAQERRIRETIRQLREALGESQEEFAKRIGKSYGMVQRYEQKKAPAGKALVPFLRIALELGKPEWIELLKRGMVRDLVDSAPMEIDPAMMDGLGADQIASLIEMRDTPPSEFEALGMNILRTYMRSVPRLQVLALFNFMLMHFETEEKAELTLKGLLEGADKQANAAVPPQGPHVRSKEKEKGGR